MLHTGNTGKTPENNLATVVSKCMDEEGQTLVVTAVTGLLDLASHTRTVLSPEATNY
jgi:hypothetical protein